MNVNAVVNLYRPLTIRDIVVKDYYEDPDWVPASIEGNAAITEQQKNIIRDQLNYINQPFFLLPQGNILFTPIKKYKW